MQKTDRKMAVLMVLKEYKKPLQLPELSEILKNQFAERSLRRWLQELVEEGFVKKSGAKRSTSYEAIEIQPKQEAIEVLTKTIFSEQSEQVISYVKQPLYLRNPVGYQNTWLASYEPNKTFYLSQEQRKHLKQEGARRYQHEIAGTYARHIYNRLMIDLSYNSSRLEGNTYSLLETEKLILAGEISENKLSTDEVMILNHKEAIRYLVDNAVTLKIETQIICTLHYLLADGLLPASACGIIRAHGVKVGGSTYLPIDNKLKLENNLADICRKAAVINDPYEQSFFLLVHIAYLQAFEDCNKRTSRLSANIPLIRDNLVPMSFNDVPKEDYTNAMLSIYELNKVQPLVDLYLYSYLRTCKQYDISIESIGFDRIKIQYRQQRREVISAVIHRKLKSEDINAFILQQSRKLVPEKDQQQFALSVQEDINNLTLSQILGMGVSTQEFNMWKETK
jgi:Fic family protein